jgi:chlorobactene glucosyltransferase
VLASTYEKLEIIVLDDSSDDDTSVLIRSFAHVGVRFVPGSKLPDGWLGKNHALDILAEEASGDYIIFMDVDTFIEPDTIGKLMATMIAKNATMLSVIPRRNDVWRFSVLFGSLRYFWQLILASPGAPAASGALWAIRSDTLQMLGGIAPHRGEVQAEAHLATLVGASYLCLIDDGKFGVSYEKKWRSQVETSRRLLYPMARGWRAIGVILLLVLLNAPFFALLSGLVYGGNIFMQLAALAVLVAYMGLYGMYAHSAWRRNWWFAGVLWPLIIAQELALFVWSVVGYLRRTITWKGRLVTAQVTQSDSLEIDQ